MTQKQIEQIKLWLSLDSLEKIVRDYFNLDYNKPFKSKAAVCYIVLVLHVRNIHFKEQITQEQLADKMGISIRKVSVMYRLFRMYKHDYIFYIEKLLTQIYF